MFDIHTHIKTAKGAFVIDKRTFGNMLEVHCIQTGELYHVHTDNVQCIRDSALDAWRPVPYIIKVQKQKEPTTTEKKPEHTGKSVDYYKVPIKHATTNCNETKADDVVYVAECNDIMEALNMNHTESNIFKEIWRTAAARTLGKEKLGHTALYGAEKVDFFSDRLVVRVKNGY